MGTSRRSGLSGPEPAPAHGHVQVEGPALAAWTGSLEVDGIPARLGAPVAVAGAWATVSLRVATETVVGRLTTTVPVAGGRTTRVFPFAPFALGG
jgi:hypothetical protein